jgi:lysophospholipase L1-like esterase
MPGIPRQAGAVIVPAPYDATTAVLPSGLSNVRPQNLQHWRKALASVRDGTGRAKLLLLGDSTTAGTGSGSGGTSNTVGAYAHSFPRALAPLLARSVTVNDNSFIGDQSMSVVVTPYNSYDPRVTIGTGWTYTPGTIGGFMFKFNPGANTLLSFAPAAAFDTMVIWYSKSSTGGSFTVNVDGGATISTINTNAGTSSLSSSTLTVAKATHTININASNNTTFFILGIITYDSAVPAVDLIQGGAHGSSVAGLVSAGGSPWSPVPALSTFAPDLTVMDLTINDSENGTALDTYRTGLQQLITAAQATGDVILMVGPPSNTTIATNGTLDQYIAVMRSLALANNCGMLDLKTRWVSYAVTNPVLPYSDSKHPGRLGYQDIAAAVYAAIRD